MKKFTSVEILNYEDRYQPNTPYPIFMWYTENYDWRNIELTDEVREQIQIDYEAYCASDEFKENEKPIEFLEEYDENNNEWVKTSDKPYNYDVIVVLDKTTFVGIDKDFPSEQIRFKGILNNGKVK